MHTLTRQAIAGAKPANALAQCSLLALQSLGVAFAVGQRGQEMLDQCRHRLSHSAASMRARR